jgi:integrase
VEPLGAVARRGLVGCAGYEPLRSPATYYRRFLLLRRFFRWVSRRDGAHDPFLDLDPPPKPRQERDWLIREEFRRLLDAAGRPERNMPSRSSPLLGKNPRRRPSLISLLRRVTAPIIRRATRNRRAVAVATPNRRLTLRSAG